jgi:hypothetical protein
MNILNSIKNSLLFRLVDTAAGIVLFTVTCALVSYVLYQVTSTNENISATTVNIISEIYSYLADAVFLIAIILLTITVFYLTCQFMAKKGWIKTEWATRDRDINGAFKNLNAFLYNSLVLVVLFCAIAMIAISGTSNSSPLGLIVLAGGILLIASPTLLRIYNSIKGVLEMVV